MNYLKIIIGRFDCSLALQIVDMDERFRYVEGRPQNIFTASNGIIIKSFLRPGFRVYEDPYNELLYLWGVERETDQKFIQIYTESNEERDIVAERIVSAIRDFPNWPGFRDDIRNGRQCGVSIIEMTH